jgi:hypothetical protein
MNESEHRIGAADLYQRLPLIDQLLAANADNPAAIAALNQARTRLTGGGKLAGKR